MHIDVDPDIAVIRAHEISHDVQKILEEVDWVRSVLVHMCPYGAGKIKVCVEERLDNLASEHLKRGIIGHTSA